MSFIEKVVQHLPSPIQRRLPESVRNPPIRANSLLHFAELVKEGGQDVELHPAVKIKAPHLLSQIITYDYVINYRSPTPTRAITWQELCDHDVDVISPDTQSQPRTIHELFFERCVFTAVEVRIPMIHELLPDRKISVILPNGETLTDEDKQKLADKMRRLGLDAYSLDYGRHRRR